MKKNEKGSRKLLSTKEVSKDRFSSAVLMVESLNNEKINEIGKILEVNHSDVKEIIP